MPKIPKDANRVFQGIIFDVYQWQQPMYDGSRATFEALSRPDTVVILPLTGDDEVVVIDAEQPMKARSRETVGGRVDPGEEPLAAAKRELLEETGYSSSSWELWFSYQPLHKADWTVWYFIARDATKTADQNLDAGEKIDVEVVKVTEFINWVVENPEEMGRLGLYILQQALADKRDELERFLSNRKN